MNITDRFLKYVSFHTTSDENTGVTPSTPGQMVLAKYIRQELIDMGMQEVELDERGYLMATLPANTEGKPVIGFIAHLDTAPDASGENIRPRIVSNYDGQDILLNEEQHIVLETAPRYCATKGRTSSLLTVRPFSERTTRRAWRKSSPPANTLSSIPR